VPGDEQTYAAAGVSLATADAVVERLRAAVDSTRTPGVHGAFGGFAGLYALDDERLLAASTDSVGTKLVLARRAGTLRWCGADLAAHGINDVATTGAEPLFFLDYVAAGRIDPEQIAELVEGAADVCRAVGCAILGGETAELPGIYRDEELDFCGTVVGLVRRDALVDGSRARPGDVVLGFRSAGLHANGFSLVRRIVGDDDVDAELLLPPTRCYLDEVRALRRRADVRALARRRGRRPLGVGAARGVRLARRARGLRGRAAAGLQHRHRLLRGRPGGPRPARRPRDRAPRVGRHRSRVERRVIGVLVSGEGTNLQALIDAGLPIVAVASNRGDAPALVRAEAAGIPIATFEAADYASREERDLALARWLTAQGVELAVLAGYMHILRPPFFEAFAGRVVNTHSAPLPEFPGAHPIEDVLAAGVPETAATVHWVDEGVDTGTVIRAVRVPVEAGDTPETLRARVQAVEHRLLPDVVRELVAA
jgi:formyltetrahydrofolate-dependent phosphoribosylglycinamide formyltransferase